jgi:BolA family transcriptional regulator, general stress-responsive regulator
MRKRIEACLRDVLNPEFLEVLDQSHKHQGHLEHAENSHFLIRIQAQCLEHFSTIEKHKKVNDCLKAFYNEGVHSISCQFV